MKLMPWLEYRERLLPLLERKLSHFGRSDARLDAELRELVPVGTGDALLRALETRPAFCECGQLIDARQSACDRCIQRCDHCGAQRL